MDSSLASMSGGLFALFGVVFIIIAIAQAVYNFSATSKNRYSVFDITDASEKRPAMRDLAKAQSFKRKKILHTAVKRLPSVGGS